MKNIHIGCGYTIGKNWINYDNSPVALIDKMPVIRKILFLNKFKFPREIKYGNIVKKKLCNINSADNIFCSHVVEHVSFSEAKIALDNIYQMLKPGGNFRIIVPSLKARVDEYLDTKDANLFMNSLGCVNEDENKGIIAKTRFLFGNSRHKWMYDDISLYNMLIEQGFKNIRKCIFGDSGLNIFSEVENIDRFIENDGKYKAVAFHCSK